MSATSILLFGGSGVGKSCQIGRLAEDVFSRTGKKTRVYHTDRGGWDVNQPYMDLGIMEVIALEKSDIWIFINKAVQGFVRDANGKWTLDAEANKQIGCYAFESAHSMAKLLQQDMEAKAAKGTVIGGDSVSSFDTEDAGEKLKVTTTKGFAKYQIPQSTINTAMMHSQKLDAEYVIWTAGANRDESDIGNTKVIGPLVIGNALTGTLSGDFQFTFRMDFSPAKGTEPSKHYLFLGPSADLNAGNATALGNIRRPLDAPKLAKFVLEPADLPLALKMVRDDASKAATETIRKRLALAGRKV